MNVSLNHLAALCIVGAVVLAGIDPAANGVLVASLVGLAGTLSGRSKDAPPVVVNNHDGLPDAGELEDNG